MGSKKKILYVITKSNLGGAQRYVYDLAINLSADRFEAVVALGGKGLLKDKLEEAGIRVISIPRLGRDVKFLDEFYVFYRLLRLYFDERPDVVHLNSSKIGGLGAFTGRVFNLLNSLLHLLQPLYLPKFLQSKNLGGQAYSLQPVKTIFTSHGWAFNEERTIWARVAIRFLAWLTIALSHHTIAVSSNIAESAPRIFIPKDKISVIRNGVSLSPPLERDEARKALGAKIGIKFEDDTLHIVTVAELHRNKGLSYAIEALAVIKKSIGRKVSYTILGEGERRKELEKLVKRHKLSGVVKLPGFLERAPLYLKAFDIFILPSITEALGLSILEAGVAEMPVIATSVGGVPEIIEDMKTGILVRAREPRELASALKYLVENKEKAEEFGKNLSQKVHDEFSVDRMARETSSLYISPGRRV